MYIVQSILSIKTNTKEKMEKYNRKTSMLIKTRYPNTMRFKISFIYFFFDFSEK